MCGSRNYPDSHHGRPLEILRGGGIFKSQTFRGNYEAILEFSGMRRGAKQKTFRVGVWISSGSTQFCKKVNRLALQCQRTLQRLQYYKNIAFNLTLF